MKTFRKIAAVALSAAMVFALAACGNGGNTTTGTSATSATSGSGSADKVYRVGICQLVQHVALDAATQGFQDKLKELLGDNVEFDYQNASGDSAQCATIVNSFVASNVDLIMANATPALIAAAQATSTIPILGTSITEYGVALGIDNFSGTTGYNVSGTSDLAPLADQAAIFKEILPDAKQIGLVYCSAEPNSLYQVTVVAEELQKLGYSTNMYSFTDTNDIATVVQNAVDNSDALYIPTDNSCADNTGVIDQIARPAGVPIICGEEGICSGCGIATLSIKYYDIGSKTGEMAYDILVNGADITKMAIEYAPQFTKEYNAEICKDLNITIPSDYVAIEG